MRAEEIKGLIEAYSKVNETPEVSENLNEVAVPPKNADAARRQNADASNVINRVARGAVNYLKDAPAAAMSQLQGQGAVASNDAALARQQRRGQNLGTLITTGRLPGQSQTSTAKPPAAKPPGDKPPAGNPPVDKPPAARPPAPVSTTVLAKKGGVEGKLDKSTGKFTATKFTDAEKARYDARAPKPATPAPTNQGKPTTPATPQKPKASAEAQWRAANPKLAAAADEKARIRGTSQTDNPLMKDMRSKMSMTPSVQSPTLAKDLGGGSGNQSLLNNPNASKAATPKPTPTPTPAATAATDTIKKSSTTKPTMKESNLDAFDLVKGYLLDEGYAETEQNAMVIMVNMSEEWRSEILDELYKGKHGQSEKEYMAGRSDAGKRISGDEKEGPASYASRWHKGSEPTKPGQKPKNVQKLAKWEKDDLQIRKNTLKKKEEEKKEMAKEEYVDESSYSAKAARAGKDIGKPGKEFAKIAKEAGERYGSEEAGKRVAGAVLAKLRKEEVEEIEEAQRARENPEDHDKEEKRKYEPVRGERTPMPPRGDKRREEFEKWYAKQMGR